MTRAIELPWTGIPFVPASEVGASIVESADIRAAAAFDEPDPGFRHMNGIVYPQPNQCFLRNLSFPTALGTEQGESRRAPGYHGDYGCAHRQQYQSQE